MKRNRLFWDIETSPNIGLFWRSGYKQNVDYGNILFERQIMCICWKWEQEDEVGALDWRLGEKEMIESFMGVLNRADESVAHNGDKFDLPWIRGRCLYHGLPMFPTYKTLDTLKLVKGKNGFGLNSNRLDYIACFLGIGCKQETKYGMWKELTKAKFLPCTPEEKISANKTMNKMVEYCKNDVVLLQEIYERIKNYTKPTTHYGVLNGGDKTLCPECGSYRVVLNKTTTTALGTIRRNMMCNECRRYFTVSNKTYHDIVDKRRERRDEEG